PRPAASTVGARTPSRSPQPANRGRQQIASVGVKTVCEKWTLTGSLMPIEKFPVRQNQFPVLPKSFAVRSSRQFDRKGQFLQPFRSSELQPTRPQFEKIPCIFLDTREIGRGKWSADDCPPRQLSVHHYPQNALTRRPSWMPSSGCARVGRPQASPCAEVAAA